jgi:hypothetical protein
MPNGRRIVATTQIGDGALGAFVRRSEGPAEFDYIPLASPDEGAIGGGTRFLTQVESAQLPDRVHVNPLPPETAAIVLATDGVSDDFKPLRENYWLLLRRLQKRVLWLPDDVAADRLLHELQWSRPDSFDDRTLLIIHSPVAAPPLPTEPPTMSQE